MSYVTDAELMEIVPDLRALAQIETMPEVRAALIRLADRYAGFADDRRTSEALSVDDALVV